jgi:DNA polymerase-1
MISNTFIDADSMIFKCAYGNPSISKMKERWKRNVDFIVNNTFADQYKIALRGKDNFRAEIYDEYKANRPQLDGSVVRNLKKMNDYAMEHGGGFASDGWEADDQVCAWAYEADKAGEAYVIAGIDKDLLQYPGNHYNYGGTVKKPMPEEDRWTFVSPEEGRLALFAQLIQGDKSDNIIGVHGMGAVKSRKALIGKTDSEKMYKIIEIYKKEFGDRWEEQLVLNGHLIYMRRWKEERFDHKAFL